MIINKDINPEREIYYLGALVIDILNNNSYKKMDFFELFQALNEKIKISVYLYILTLDWLFILGLITKKQEAIIKCF
ncbi:MAG: hypothetical protein M0R46_08140 [Candidatus Muirbacterium halophilum]|nr:hypothetical protein [Candidatus Muirbacterium halophilum]MCK9475872.1 hypothetical protein [Candidatus Muirbacterium halophilum]